MFSNNNIQNEINKHVLDKLSDSKCKWDWYQLCRNPMITWDILQTNPDKPRSWWALSYNPNITYDIVEANPGKPWSWEVLKHEP